MFKFSRSDLKELGYKIGYLAGISIVTCSALVFVALCIKFVFWLF